MSGWEVCLHEFEWDFGLIILSSTCPYISLSLKLAYTTNKYFSFWSITHNCIIIFLVPKQKQTNKYVHNYAPKASFNPRSLSF